MTIETVIPLYGGYTLGKNDGVVFVKGAIPGETVVAEIVEKKKDYRVARVKNIITVSPDRITPPCSVFDICGGCHYQYISYERQVRIKEEITLDCLRRIAKLDISLDASLIDSPWHYRKRVQLKVSRDGRIGFYRPLSHDVVEFEECLIVDPQINQVIKKLKRGRKLTGIKEIHLQKGDTVVAKIIADVVNEKEVVELLKGSDISGALLNSEALYGDSDIYLTMEVGFNDMPRLSYLYRVSAGTFYQSNWSLNQRLIGLILKYIKNINPVRVLDLYAGAGNLSLPASAFSREVIAVEENSQACNDGINNLSLNNIHNVRFINKKAEGINTNLKAEVIILDPPRQGLSMIVKNKLMSMAPEWIIYLSCNPTTFCRDLKVLSERYEIESLRVIDMFPQTYHIELLGILKMKNN
jgi:23S rRNA (uracil1939-C5)-methyltransferase